VEVFPAKTFFPYANPRWFKRVPGAERDSYAAHHWANSWAKENSDMVD
jgi:hypothetical protein